MNKNVNDDALALYNSRNNNNFLDFYFIMYLNVEMNNFHSFTNALITHKCLRSRDILLLYRMKSELLPMVSWIILNDSGQTFLKFK
jgi:hypothetical protein